MSDEHVYIFFLDDGMSSTYESFVVDDATDYDAVWLADWLLHLGKEDVAGIWGIARPAGRLLFASLYQCDYENGGWHVQSFRHEPVTPINVRKLHRWP